MRYPNFPKAKPTVLELFAASPTVVNRSMQSLLEDAETLPWTDELQQDRRSAAVSPEPGAVAEQDAHSDAEGATPTAAKPVQAPTAAAQAKAEAPEVHHQLG